MRWVYVAAREACDGVLELHSKVKAGAKLETANHVAKINCASSSSGSDIKADIKVSQVGGEPCWQRSLSELDCQRRPAYGSRMLGDGRKDALRYIEISVAPTATV